MKTNVKRSASLPADQSDALAFALQPQITPRVKRCGAGLPVAAHRYLARHDRTGLDWLPCDAACDVPRKEAR